MKNLSSTASRLAIIILLSACASAIPAPFNPSDVPVLGAIGERMELAGTWTGSVTFPDPALSTSVTFRIEPGPDGDAGHLFATNDPRAPRFLYLRVQGSKMSSAAPAVYDEACRCSVYTTFSGHRDGDVITGEIRRIENRTRLVLGTLKVSRVIDRRTS